MELDTSKTRFEAYTDGSCNNLSPYGEGGAAYIVLEDGREVKRASKGFLGKTNNFCELIAIYSAVMSIPEGSSITIYTDSRYAIGALSKRGFPNLNGVANSDVLKRYYADRGDRDVRFVWVKGHSGNFLNEECDKMADAETAKIRVENNIPIYNTKNSPKVKNRLATWGNNGEHKRSVLKGVKK